LLSTAPEAIFASAASARAVISFDFWSLPPPPDAELQALDRSVAAAAAAIVDRSVERFMIGPSDRVTRPGGLVRSGR
jgi:hypothetical protein